MSKTDKPSQTLYFAQFSLNLCSMQFPVVYPKIASQGADKRVWYPPSRMNPPEYGNNTNSLEVDIMAEYTNEENKAKRRSVVEKMWLNYFNNSLLEKGLITETQHRKMKTQISSRKVSALERWYEFLIKRPKPFYQAA